VFDNFHEHYDFKTCNATICEKRMSRPDLSIVIINYRMAHLLRPCLVSVFSCREPLNYEVILVNKPSDDGAEKLADEFPSLRIVTYPHFGISVMRNAGILQAQGRHILNLDADTEVRPGALKALVDFMDTHPDTGVAGGKTFHKDGSMEFSCKRFYTPLTILSRRTPIGAWFPNNRWERRHLMMDEDHDTPLSCDWVAGACFCVRREAFEQVGLFDESFYFGFEDVDFCYRAKKANWQVRYVPDAIIIHHVQRKSLGFNHLSWEHLKSGLRFWWKHYVRGGKK